MQIKGFNMTPKQLKQLKELSDSFQSGQADTKTIRELSRMMEKIQTERNNEINFNRAQVIND
jgi:hypothetical protein